MPRGSGAAMFAHLLFAAVLGVPIAPAAVPSPPVTATALRREVATAVGYEVLRTFAGVRLEGSFVEAGAPGAIDVTLAFATGYSREAARTGALLAYSGYDGASWQAQDGVVTVDDLPGDAADAATSAWLGREGESDAGDDTVVSAPQRKTERGAAFDVATFVPKGGSPVEMWFDAASHLLARAIFFTDGGSLRTDYDDYRRFDGVAVALREHDVDPTGASSDTKLASVTLLTALPPAALARVAPENRAHLARAASVPFRSDLDGGEGHVVVPASLDGHVVNVDFDSGGANAIVPEAASAIGLALSGGLEVGGVGNGSEPARTARVARLAIGDAELDDQPFLVLPLPNAVVHPRAGLEVDGLVGFEMLANFRTRVDYGRHVLTFSRFEDPDPLAPGAVVLPFRSDGHTPYVEATIDGVRGLFEIDTGASATVTIFDTFARAHGLFTQGGVTYASPGGVGGTVAEQVLRARSFEIAGTAFPTPVVALSKTTAGAFASRSIAGNIGSGILARFVVTFDYRARTVTFEPRTNVAAIFLSDHTGLAVASPAPGTIRVLGVLPGSPAARAGIATGDRIVELDGRATGTGTLGDLAVLRGGWRAFDLTVERGTQRLESHLVPRDLLGDPQ